MCSSDLCADFRSAGLSRRYSAAPYLYFRGLADRHRADLSGRAPAGADARHCRSEERRVGKECRSRGSPDH